MSFSYRFALCGLLLLPATPSPAQNPSATITVDTNINRHAISPYIYGVAFADRASLSDLNIPINRSGGDATTRYNWKLNAYNAGADWFFESVDSGSAVAGAGVDTFVKDAKSAGAQAMITIPMIGYVANLGPNRTKLSSFSIARYGAQTGSDWQWFPDAGNGILKSTGKDVTGNNPLDANIVSTSTFQQGWVQHLVSKWGTAAKGGPRYYLTDNEPSLWFSTHRDVHPIGPKMDEIASKILDYGAKIKAVDPTALLVGPEEWGWSGYFYSGYDQQYGGKNGWGSLPDRKAHGGQDYLPWLLTQLHQHQVSTGQRLLDVFSVHFYPQGGEYWGGVDTATQLLRNRSTRQLWDPNYVSESWIGSQVQLIPRLKNWVNTYYPGTQTAITEYDWGADDNINGATAQADILGIFGREGLDMAAHWMSPTASTPAYNAFKIYRNYDGAKSTFGDTSVSDIVPNPDNLSSFAAVRSTDGALTLMVINKVLSGNTPINALLSNFGPGNSAEAWQLTSKNAITRLADVAITNAVLFTTVPPQSITLFVVPAGKTPSFLSTAAATPPTVTHGTAVKINAVITATRGTLTNGVVDFDVYNSSGTKINQQTATGQNFSANASHSYTWTWTPSAAGTYTVKLGITNATGNATYHWNNNAARITVK